jgi:hypothetical protein
VSTESWRSELGLIVGELNDWLATRYLRELKWRQELEAAQADEPGFDEWRQRMLARPLLNRTDDVGNVMFKEALLELPTWVLRAVADYRERYEGPNDEPATPPIDGLLTWFEEREWYCLPGEG